jgi:hypothetical protein
MNLMNDELKSKVLKEATEAAEGAMMRAQNRGWDSAEQARCAREAAQAVYGDYETSWEELVA